MGTGDWIITLSGGLVATGGAALLAWAVLWDGLRTRRARRAGGLRRCPRCWYDMAGVAALKCTECGRVVRSERAFRHARRRGRWATLAGTMLAVGAALGALPHGRDSVWSRWLPDTAVVLAVPWADDGWALEEMARRLRVGASLPFPEVPNRLSAASWVLLTESCLRVVKSSPERSELAWRVLAVGPCSTRATKAAIEVLQRAGVPGPESAYLAAHVPSLSDADLQTTLKVVGTTKSSQPGVGTDTDRLVAAILDREEGGSWSLGSRLLEHSLARKRDGYTDIESSVEKVDLNPDAIVAAMGRCSYLQVAALRRRLGLPPRPDSEASRDPGLSAFSLDLASILIDDDERPDALVRITDGRFETQLLAFVRRGGGWRCVGTIDDAAYGDTPSWPESEESAGRRWLRSDSGARTAELKGAAWSSWYRVGRGGLELAQHVVIAAGEIGTIVQRSLRVDRPRLLRVDGRDVVGCEVRGGVVLSLWDRPGARLDMPLWQGAGRCDFPLMAGEGSLGRLLPGAPWQGRLPDWVLDRDDAAVLAGCRDGLVRLARENPRQQEAILGYLRSNSDDPQYAALYQFVERESSGP
ncbi:MAG: hypothetical protein IPJ41_18465 [Phycisphaerales bacterium]|nr:hypothetical protein [Phycisphaerales bacterium]